MENILIPKKLKEAVEHDENNQKGFHNYQEKLDWIIERAKHYSEKTGIDASEIIKGWEEQRDYWYMNFYQEANQPEIKADKVIIAESSEDFFRRFPSRKWICPNCKGISKDPFLCDSGVKLKLINGSNKKEICNWSAGGLFGTLGNGVHVFLKDKMKLVGIFKPLELKDAKGDKSE